MLRVSYNKLDYVSYVTSEKGASIGQLVYIARQLLALKGHSVACNLKRGVSMVVVNLTRWILDSWTERDIWLSLFHPMINGLWLTDCVVVRPWIGRARIG